MEGTTGRRPRVAGRLLLVAVVVAALVVAPFVGAASATWESTLVRGRVSVDSNGAEGPRGSEDPAASMDGQYVAFRTRNAFAAGDSESERDIYVRDTDAGTSTWVSMNKDGDEANSNSYDPAISADGRYVAFYSYASDMADPDTDGSGDIFLHDMQTGTTTLVSVNKNGDDSGNGDSYGPAISADGRYVAFESYASDIADPDTDNSGDVFVRDMETGTTTLVSVDKDGNEANSDSWNPSVCFSGRYIAFTSVATDLVDGDTNGEQDVFLRDMQTGKTQRVSVASDGTQGDDTSGSPSVSMGGLYVAFDSKAGNLSPDDMNGGGDHSRDVFVRDVENGTTMLVSEHREGMEELDRGANLKSERALSYDGRMITFVTGQDLLPEDVNGEQDFYVRDLATGEFTIVNEHEDFETDGWAENNEETCHTTFSGDGSTIAFDSWDDDIVPNDNNSGSYSGRDCFVWGITPAVPFGDVRWAGATRYDTAVAVSEGTFPRGADTVVIATGANWPDALCGSALAGAVDGPILLTPADALPQTVKDEIDRLGAEDAFILGGTGVVSTAVESELETMLDGSVNRLGGANRYVTGNLVAMKVAHIYGDDWDGGAIVTTGENFADALAGAPLAAGLGWPVLLANPTTSAVYQPDEMTEVVILGGTGAVPMAVEMAIKNGPLSNQDVTRVGGATRYETAAMTAEYGVDNGLLWNGVGIATGENFPDGLAGGASLGLNRTVMLLTPTASLAPAAATQLTANADAIASVQFLGGPGAVSTAVEDQVKGILGM